MDHSEAGLTENIMTVEYTVDGMCELPIKNKREMEHYNISTWAVNLQPDDGKVGFLTEPSPPGLKHAEFRRMNGLPPKNNNEPEKASDVNKFPIQMTYRSRGEHPLPSKAIHAINSGTIPNYTYEGRLVNDVLLLKASHNTVAHRAKEFKRLEFNRKVARNSLEPTNFSIPPPQVGSRGIQTEDLNINTRKRTADGNGAGSSSTAEETREAPAAETEDENDRSRCKYMTTRSSNK